MLFRKPTYTAPRRIVLVQVKLEQQQQHIRYAVVTRKSLKGGQLPAWIPVENTEALVKKAGKGKPYVLHFTGFGVLARIAELAPNYREGLLVNGGEEDFYFSCYELRSTVGVSFIRRSLVQALVEDLVHRKVFLWSIHTGPVPLIQLLSGDQGLYFDYSIELRSGDLKTLERSTEAPARFGTPGGFHDADAAILLALSGLTFEQQEHYLQGVAPEEQEQTRSDFKEYNRFVQLGIGILAFFLITLTGNHFYVNHLNNVAAQLESDIAGYGDNLSMIGRLEQEKQRKLLLVENSGVQSSRYISSYLDEIGGSVPASIQLSTLETFPLKEPLKPKRKVELNIHHINLLGFSGNSKVLDDWMEELESKDWVKSVELINYVRLNDQKATFHLLVKIAV